MPSEPANEGDHLLVAFSGLDMAERRGSEPSIENSFMLQRPNYGNDLLRTLNQMRTADGGGFTDVVLCIGQEELRCHKNVLAASSHYFAAMFSCDLKESREDRIVFNDVSPWLLKRIIDYAYTGSIEITVDNAQELLAIGNLFGYQEIVESCCAFVQRHLHASNCLGIENFAHHHACFKLEESAHKFALDNFSSVIDCEEFLDLTLDRIIFYISSDLIDVRNEETVYHAASKWIHHNLEERQKYLYSVLEHVRLATVDLGYLEDVVENDQLVMADESCRSLVEDAKKYHETKLAADQLGKRRRSMQTPQNQPRPSTVAKEVMVLIGGINSYVLQSVEMYEPLKDKWSALPDMPTSVSWFGVSAINNCIFVTGGIVDSCIVGDVCVFNSTKRVWKKSKPLLRPRARHCSAVLDNKLYVVGGVRLDGTIVSVEEIECYDPATGEWTVVGQSPFPRTLSYLVPYHQTLLEVGGTQGDARVKTMESYHCTESGVTYSGEQFVLPDFLQFGQIVVLNGLFYILWEDSKKLISLNPDKRTFCLLPEMKYARLHCGVTVVLNKIYVTGGSIDSKPCRVVECYDPAASSWTIVKSLPLARACHGCVAIQM